jgi:hypothetical protein
MGLVGLALFAGTALVLVDRQMRKGGTAALGPHGQALLLQLQQENAKLKAKLETCGSVGLQEGSASTNLVERLQRDNAGLLQDQVLLKAKLGANFESLNPNFKRGGGGSGNPGSGGCDDSCRALAKSVAAQLSSAGQPPPLTDKWDSRDCWKWVYGHEERCGSANYKNNCAKVG